MTPRPFLITTTEVKRILRAAKAVGASEVEIRGLHATYVIKVAETPAVDTEREIVL